MGARGAEVNWRADEGASLSARTAELELRCRRPGTRMATIAIDRTHDLPHDKARNLAERLATDLAQRYGFAWRWDDDDIRFQRPGVSGFLHIGASQIRLDITLGLLLAPFRASIEKQVNAELDRLTGGTTA